MSALTESAPGLILVLGIPGILVLLVARVRMTWVEAIALVPVCSIGAVWILAEICLVTGVPFAPPAFAALLVVLLVGLVVPLLRKRYRLPELVLDLPPGPHDLVELGSNQKLDELIEKYGVRYLYFGNRVYFGYGHQWTLAQLRENPRLRAVFNRQGAHVFEILPPAAAARP